MTAAKDHELDFVRERLRALRADSDTAAASAELGTELARIRGDLHRLAESHAAAWRAMQPLAPATRDLGEAS